MNSCYPTIVGLFHIKKIKMNFDILQWIPKNARKSPSGWWSFNAPCCIHNGESVDTRSRGGLKSDGDNWSYNCFNCKFKVRHVFGKSLSNKSKKLLKWLGVDQKTIQQYMLENLRNESPSTSIQKRKNLKNEKLLEHLSFQTYELPSNARLITKNDIKFYNYIECERGLSIDSYNFYITPDEKFRKKNRIIIPYYWNNNIVGWVSRYLDNNKPKYLAEHQQPGFLFGTNLQKPEWQYIFVVEGEFDAISIKGVATLHNDISTEQIAWLRQTGKEIIVIPDHDKSGFSIINSAIDAGFSISIPKWDENIKDINDAVKYYGRVGTLLSILKNKTRNKIKIKLAKNGY